MERCSRCGAETPPEERHEHGGQLLCDDCYMDALSPAKTCDPWATYTASRLDTQELNPRQEAILEVIDQRGRVPVAEMRQAVGLSQKELEREVAALRHMELIRGALGSRPGERLLCRFDDRD